MLGNEIADDLARALNRFDAEQLAEALNRHTVAMQNLTTSIDRLVRSLPVRSEEDELEKKPNPSGAQR